MRTHVRISHLNLWAYICPLGLFGRNREPANGFYDDPWDWLDKLFAKEHINYIKEKDF